MKKVEDQAQLSPEEYTKRKEEMMEFWTKDTPFWKAKVDYERLLTEADELYLRRVLVDKKLSELVASDPSTDTNQQGVVGKERTLKKV